MPRILPGVGTLLWQGGLSRWPGSNSVSVIVGSWQLILRSFLWFSLLSDWIDSILWIPFDALCPHLAKQLSHYHRNPHYSTYLIFGARYTWLRLLNGDSRRQAVFTFNFNSYRSCFIPFHEVIAAVKLDNVVMIPQNYSTVAGNTSTTSPLPGLNLQQKLKEKKISLFFCIILNQVTLRAAEC